MTREERKLSIEYLEGVKENYIEGYGYERHPLPEYYAIENAIKTLEQTSNKWHLVKDKLPDKYSYVNITCHSLIDSRPNWVVETCYVPQYPSSPYSDWGNIPMLNDGECEVVAWMYRNIPEPYKSEE